jgi:phosphonoacetate hydrolase
MASTDVRQLSSSDLIGRVDGVAERLDADRFEFRSPVGSVTWRRVTGANTEPETNTEHRAPAWHYEIEHSEGVNLLDANDTTKFLSLQTEHSEYAHRPTAQVDHGRPYAYDSLSQLFSDPKTPDVLLVPAAGFPLHGNLGNHGSLTSVQSRGLFFAAGPGVANSNGWIPKHARTIDVAPTVMALLGSPVVDSITATGAIRSDARLRAQDGDEIGSVLATSTELNARHVVVILLDGANTNLVADAMEKGELPTLAALLKRGTGLRHGIVSSFPTVTLPNHVTAFTGVHPGRHGVINNEFLSLDNRHINLLEFREMINTYTWLSPEVETLHEAIHRWQPDAFTSAMYEYADRGADWSTYAEFRAKNRPFSATEEQARATSIEEAYENASYRFMARVDESALAASLQQWSGATTTGHALPTLQLLNINVTDSAGHESGPHGMLARAALIDSDRRVARLLEAIDAAGAMDDTAFVVMSDHGMEQCDPALVSHPHADLTPLLASVGRREVGDALLYRR